jgi:hypothetical protein
MNLISKNESVRFCEPRTSRLPCEWATHAGGEGGGVDTYNNKG